MALGIGELADLEVGPGDLVGAEDPRAAEALGLGERRPDVWDLDVERDVARVVGSRARRDPTADSGALPAPVALSGDDAVAQRVVRVDLPVESSA